MSPSLTWTSNFHLNLAILSYILSPEVPTITSQWLVHSRIGIFLLVPPQIILCFIITIPCIFVELVLGQYSNKGMIKVWDLCPAFRGIGICACITCLTHQICTIYLSSAKLYFVYLSIRKEAVWSLCNQNWNRINCFNLINNTKCEECQTSMEQFYLNKIYNSAESSLGQPQQELLLAAFITLFVIFLSNFGGPKSTEKYIITISILTTLQLVLLFLIPITKSNLIHLFTKFNHFQFAKLETWTSLIGLSVTSPGLGFGVFVTLASHFSFRHSLHFKTMSFGLFGSLFTTLYSIAIQNYVIDVCDKNYVSLSDCFKFGNSELGLPESLFFFPKNSRVWIVLWLSNVYLLALRKIIVMMIINTQIIYDSFPKLRKYHNFVISLYCLFIFITLLFLSTRIGYLFVKIINHMLNKFVVLFLTTITMLVIVFIYGIKKFKDDLHFMLGIKSSIYFIFFFILLPLLFCAVYVYNIVEFYTTNKIINWTYVFQNIILYFSPIFIFLYVIFYSLVTISESKFLKASNAWGPRYFWLRKSREMFKAYNMAKEYLYRQERFVREFGSVETD